jgi:glycosyltransferase involved in cell wall biosynthesis
MRILRVAQDIFPDVVGGAPYHIHALSRDQAARGHEVTVLTVSDDVDRPTRERRDGYTVVQQPPKLDLFGNKLFSDTLGQLRRRDEYDVVHAHSHLFYSTNVAALYSRFDETPLAMTCHGLGSQRVPEWVSNTHLRTVGKWSYNTADTVFCYTPTERDRLRDLGVSSRVEVVRNGIDTGRFSPDGETVNRIADAEGPTVLFVGRLVEGKCPEDVLDAFERVHEDVPDATLFFVGGGPLRDELDAATDEAGLDDSVVFLDHVPYQVMPSVYRAADLLVLASRAEGMPRTVLEALSCGTPVVSTQLEQIVPLVEQAGETVPVGAVGELAAAITDILGDPDRRERLGEAGREVITDQYDWSRTVAETTAALADLAGTEERPRTAEPAAPDGGERRL